MSQILVPDYTSILQNEIDQEKPRHHHPTVDGRNPAPVDT